MKRLIAKLIYFFRSKRLSKYLITILFYVGIFALVFVFSKDEVVTSILGTIIGFLASGILIYFAKAFFGSIEDVTKVSGDTKEMLDIYDGDPSYKKEIILNGTSQVVAYADLLVNKGYKFIVEDNPDKEFTLDDFIANNFVELFNAHTRSAIENSITIRLDDYKLTAENTYTLYLSRSTYYNHLVTNRVIDFQLDDHLTLRQIYDFGPKVTPLGKSKMSNHIGINGLVFLNDGHLIVPRRRNDSTISKNKVTSSIAVKFNFPHGVSPYGKLTEEDLFKTSILEALDSRLHLKDEYIENNPNIQIEFLGFGSNIYEGGKPQMYFAIFLDDVDLATYYSLIGDKKHKTKLDQDKAIYPVIYDKIHFDKKGNLVLPCYIEKHKRYENITLGYEKSFLCNIWHYQQYLNNK